VSTAPLPVLDAEASDSESEAMDVDADALPGSTDVSSSQPAEVSDSESEAMDVDSDALPGSTDVRSTQPSRQGSGVGITCMACNAGSPLQLDDATVDSGPWGLMQDADRAVSPPASPPAAPYDQAFTQSSEFTIGSIDNDMEDSVLVRRGRGVGSSINALDQTLIENNTMEQEEDQDFESESDDINDLPHEAFLPYDYFTGTYYGANSEDELEVDVQVHRGVGAPPALVVLGYNTMEQEMDHDVESESDDINDLPCEDDELEVDVQVHRAVRVPPAPKVAKVPAATALSPPSEFRCSHCHAGGTDIVENLAKRAIKDNRRDLFYTAHTPTPLSKCVGGGTVLAAQDHRALALDLRCRLLSIDDSKAHAHAPVSCPGSQSVRNEAAELVRNSRTTGAPATHSLTPGSEDSDAGMLLQKLLAPGQELYAH